MQQRDTVKATKRGREESLLIFVLGHPWKKGWSLGRVWRNQWMSGVMAETQGGCIGETKNENEEGGTRRGHRPYSTHHCPKVSQGKLLDRALRDTRGHV